MSRAPTPDRLRALPFEDWPASDRLAWQSASTNGSEFDHIGLATHWSVKNKRQVLKSYGQWLSWYRDFIGPLDEGEPAQRAARDALKAYYGFLKGRISHLTKRPLSPCTIESRIRDLYEFIRVTSPATDLSLLKHVINRLRATSKPARGKAARLIHSRGLYQLGIDLMAEAEQDDSLYANLRAARNRTGLIIAILALRPIRLANLAAIEIGRHLQRTGTVYQLCFEASELKDRDGAALEFPLPEELTPPLDRYLDDYRHQLLHGRRNNRLWISTRGTSMSEHAIYCHVVAVTEKAFGWAISPHLFRDCAATSIVLDDPAHVEIVARILGHRCLKTGERHYIAARMLEASREYGQLIQAERKASSVIIGRGAQLPLPWPQPPFADDLERLMTGPPALKEIMSAMGHTSRRKTAPISMSAFGGKADVNHCVGECPLIAISGHKDRS